MDHLNHFRFVIAVQFPNKPIRYVFQEDGMNVDYTLSIYDAYWFPNKDEVNRVLNLLKKYGEDRTSVYSIHIKRSALPVDHESFDPRLAMYERQVIYPPKLERKLASDSPSCVDGCWSSSTDRTESETD